jgi:hypothetical protein
LVKHSLGNPHTFWFRHVSGTVNVSVGMASMKKEEARRAVLSEYDRWAKKHPNNARMMGGFLFYRHLQKERSDLLDFRAVGDDKWQIVHGWLRDRLED